MSIGTMEFQKLIVQTSMKNRQAWHFLLSFFDFFRRLYKKEEMKIAALLPTKCEDLKMQNPSPPRVADEGFFRNPRA